MEIYETKSRIIFHLIYCSNFTLNGIFGKGTRYNFLQVHMHLDWKFPSSLSLSELESIVNVEKLHQVLISSLYS